MKKGLKYTGVVLITSIIVLMLTNPSLNQFKEHIGNHEVKPYVLEFNRESNWLIFSIYRVKYKNTGYEYSDYDKERELDELAGIYTGIFMNFHKWKGY